MACAPAAHAMMHVCGGVRACAPVQVIETSEPLRGPEDEKDMWEGDSFEVRPAQMRTCCSKQRGAVSHASQPRFTSHTFIAPAVRVLEMGPQDFGKTMEKFFLPGVVVLGLIIGGIAAGTYNDGADTFIKS